MEHEIPEDVREFIEQEEESIEMDRETWVNRCMGALDILTAQNKAAVDGINSISNLLNRANTFERDPDFRVRYLVMPDGIPAMQSVPKGKMGFPYKDKNI